MVLLMRVGSSSGTMAGLPRQSRKREDVLEAVPGKWSLGACYVSAECVERLFSSITVAWRSGWD